MKAIKWLLYAVIAVAVGSGLASIMAAPWDPHEAQLRKEEAQLLKQREYRQTVLGCRAASVSDAQFAACVALMTPPVPAAPTAAQQLALLRQAIPDYDQVRNPVVRWVNTDTRIPEDLRNTYKRVVRQGDVSEITDLFSRWREATGEQE
jgi:hypothetical protein